MSILGNRVVRVEDPKFLTTGGVYVDDVRDPRLAGAGWVTYVRSSLAAARITGIDTSAALDSPGVLAVYTGADVDDLEPIPPEVNGLNPTMLRPWLAHDVVRFVGEPVAAVVTVNRYQGEDAAELVSVDYEPMPVVVRTADALRDEVLLFPDAGTNVALRLDDGLDETLFADCEVVLTADIVNSKVAPAPLEARAAACAWGNDGRLTFWATTQNAQDSRDQLVEQLGLAPGAVHVITPDVGGGFGAKFGLSPEDAFLGWIARRLGRPVRWAETRSESLTAMGHGRAQEQTVTIGGRRDGTVLAYRLEIRQDVGAYPRMGGMLPELTRLMTSGVYDIARVESRAVSVVTNTAPTIAYRGAGRPEATAAIERAVDLFAAEIGMDPAAVRRRTLLPADAFPYTTAGGATYDSGDYATALDRVLAAAGYTELRAEQARRRAAGDPVQLGIGLSVYVEVTGSGDEVARIVVHADGGATVHTGTSPHGQGHATSWAMIASEHTGIPHERITVLHGDTDEVPVGGGTGGSRSLQLGGAAVGEAALTLVESARKTAADLLEADPGDLVLDRGAGRFTVAGDPGAGLTWAQLAAAAPEPLAAAGAFAAEATYPFGAHVAVVEVDTESGQVRLTRMITVDDAGRVLNPLIVEGQRHGGIAQGAAQALLEEVRYDDDGNPLTTTFADYAIVSAPDLPSFELVAMETPTPLNPLGAKGIGEAGTIGSTPAVQNAVVDALAPFGVRHLDMPASPERVWRAVQNAAER